MLPGMSRTLLALFWIVDLGFLIYWAITLLHVIPEAYLFKDYHNPILAAWNWSFLPLDLLISATGLLSVYLLRRGSPRAPRLAQISLVLTSCSGLQAVSFFALRQDFDPLWWVANLFLLLYPMLFLPRLVRAG